MVERPLIGWGLLHAPSIVPAPNGGQASDWSRPSGWQWEGDKLPEGAYQSAMDTLVEYTLLSISPAFPQSLRELDHVSSQGQEAVCATHDTLPQVVKASALYYKNIFTYLHKSTINYSGAKVNKYCCLKGEQIEPPPLIVIT